VAERAARADGVRWPRDPATPATAIAHSAEDVRALSARAGNVSELTARVSVCRACPRLVEWRERVATEKRRQYAAEPYWGRPIAGWGEEQPAVVVLGLAPAAHGGNRTGRIFTGDRSGDWLFAALHRSGLAALPTSTHAGDGQRLLGTRIVAAVRCAPPANRPTTDERDTCAPWWHRELALVAGSLRVVLALGSFAWAAALPALGATGFAIPRPRPVFGHGAEVELRAAAGRPLRRVLLIGSFHPSQQNTFTGRLTAPMLDAVVGRAAEYAGIGRAGRG